jgi:hypothetical protein
MRVAVNFELDDIISWQYNIEGEDSVLGDLAGYLREIVSRLADAGVDQVNWRAAIPKALYHSNVVPRFDGHFFGLYSEVIGEFIARHDPLEIVVDQCHRCGISPWAWLDAFDSFTPSMSEAIFEQHPSWLLQSRDRRRSLPGVPCYGNSGVRQYRLEQMRELSEYGIGGVMYSLFNSHLCLCSDCLGLRQQDQTDYAFGYNPEIVDAYKDRFGKDILREEFDPDKWGQIQGEQFGEHLTEVRNMLALAGQQLDLVIRRDNHCAGGLYPACYIANSYDFWHATGGCDQLVVESVNKGDTLCRATAMAQASPDIQWGVWHTIWDAANTVQATAELLLEVKHTGLFSQVTFHEVNTLESGCQAGSRHKAYELLQQWVQLLEGLNTL